MPLPCLREVGPIAVCEGAADELSAVEHFQTHRTARPVAVERPALGRCRGVERGDRGAALGEQIAQDVDAARGRIERDAVDCAGAGAVQVEGVEQIIAVRLGPVLN